MSVLFGRVSRQILHPTPPQPPRDLALLLYDLELSYRAVLVTDDPDRLRVLAIEAIQRASRVILRQATPPR